MGFSIFALLSNQISRFPEQLRHLQLSLTCSKNESEDCQEGDTTATLALFTRLVHGLQITPSRQAGKQRTGRAQLASATIHSAGD